MNSFFAMEGRPSQRFRASRNGEERSSSRDEHHHVFAIGAGVGVGVGVSVGVGGSDGGGGGGGVVCPLRGRTKVLRVCGRQRRNILQRSCPPETFKTLVRPHHYQVAGKYQVARLGLRCRYRWRRQRPSRVQPIPSITPLCANHSSAARPAVWFAKCSDSASGSCGPSAKARQRFAISVG